METCLREFERAWLQLPRDCFLAQGVLLLRTCPKVSQFQSLCATELERWHGPSVKLPYSLQSAWVHNVRLAKSMVAWVLGGRHSPPRRGTQRAAVHVMLPAAPTWEQCLVSTAWQMLQHVLSVSPAPPPPSSLWSSTKVATIARVRQPQIRRAPLRGEQPLPQFYPSQVNIAERLFQTLFEGKSGGRLDGYAEMDFRVLLPPSRSLRAQTVERVQRVFGNGAADLEGKVLNRCMFRGGAANADYERLREAVMERDAVSGRKRRLMMIIVDECHLGIGRGAQMDVLVNGAAHKASGEHECNAERILHEDNVYVVYVSATGWNCVPAMLPERTVVWSDDPAGYTGWKSYAADKGRNRERLCRGEGYQRMLEYFRALFGGNSGRGGSEVVDARIRTLLPTLVLMVDYALACMGSAWCSDETRNMLSSNGGHGTTVIRVQGNGGQGAMVRWLRHFVAADVTTSLCGGSEEGRRFCVLVEKGRYGDTFTGRLLHYDLRARYQSETCTLASLLQDVGRCFGYDKRSDDEEGKGPYIVLCPRAHQVFMGAKGCTVVLDRYLNKRGEANRNSMWWCGDDAERRKEVRQRWALLLAQPQVGKTGAYLKLLEMVRRRVSWSSLF